MTMRVAHLRMKHGRPLTRMNKDDLSDFDKIVTVCWQIDREEGDDTIIRYGATVYKKENSKEQEQQPKKHVDWVKRLHYQRAVQRFNDEPVIIAVRDPMNFANPLIDWWIAKNLIYKFGCNLSDKNAADIVIDIPSRAEFKLIYDPTNYRSSSSSSSSSSDNESDDEGQTINKENNAETFDMADEMMALRETQNYSSPCYGLKFWGAYGALVTVGLAFYFSL